MECLSFKPKFQNDLEIFLEKVFVSFGFQWLPDGKDADTRDIPNVYQKQGDFWLLRDGGRMIGSIALRALDHSTGEVKRFYLLPEYRRKGCGKRLLEKAIQTAPQFGFKKLRLDTTSRSTTAIHLFQKYGFKEIPRYNDNPRAEFFFELNLP